MKSKVLMIVAGGAMSLGSFAFAENPNLDRDRAYQAELSADAGVKTQQLAAAMPSGFKLTNGDSTLNLGGYTITRYALDFRSKSTVGKHDQFTNGFSVPYTKLQFWGNVAQPNLTYFIRGNFDGLDTGSSSSSGGGFVLEQAYGRFDCDSGLYFKWGQFQMPFMREDMVDQSMQLAVDRSFMLYQFNPSFVQGAEVGIQKEQWRGSFDFTDGIRTANTDYNSAAESDWSLTARVEFQAMGNNWDRWNDFTSWKGSDNGLLIGVALHAEQNGRTGDGIDNTPADSAKPGATLLMYTVDAAYESDGWNLFGAFVGSHDDPRASGTKSTDNFGLVVQGGVFVNDQVELFLRWDSFFPDKDLTSPKLKPRHYHRITGGVNYYISQKSHAAKFTADIIWNLNKSRNLAATAGGVNGSGVLPGFTGGSPVPDTRTGTLGDSKNGEIAVELAFQLKF